MKSQKEIEEMICKYEEMKSGAIKNSCDDYDKFKKINYFDHKIEALKWVLEV